MCAAAPYAGVSFLAKLADLRPSAGHFKSVDFAFDNVQALQSLLSNLSLVFGGDFLHWGYLINSPSIAITPLWLVPLLAPLWFALLSAPIDCIATRRSLRAAVNADGGFLKPDGDGASRGVLSSFARRFRDPVFYVACYYYVTVVQHAVRGLSCSDKDECNPIRPAVRCASHDRWTVFALSIIAFAVSTAAVPTLAAVFTMPRSWRSCKRRRVDGSDFDSAAARRSRPLSLFGQLVASETDGVWLLPLLFLRRAVLAAVLAADVSLTVVAVVPVAVGLVWVVVLLFFEPFHSRRRWVMYLEIACVVFELWLMVAVGFVQSAAAAFNVNLDPTSLPLGASRVLLRWCTGGALEVHWWYWWCTGVEVWRGLWVDA